jgi:uncharacterized protein (DUF58 family)
VSDDEVAEPEPGDSAESTPEWTRSSGLVFGSILAALLAGGGLLLSRPEFVLIAAPIVLSVAWAWDRRPRGETTAGVTATTSDGSRAESVDYRLAFTLPGSVEAVSLRLLARGAERRNLIVDAETARDLGGSIRLVHSGPQELLRVDYSLVGNGGGFLGVPTAGSRVSRVLQPRTVPLRDLPLPSRMLGLAGGHDSRRAGDGGEFRDVHLFTPGDRLRRIDWKVTARRAQAPGELYVRRSFATADATVLIVVDSRDNVGDLVTDWGRNASAIDIPTSMDLAREAASSLASAYIRGGDRVGFQDLASRHRLIAPGGGLRHLHRLLPVIARAEPVGAPRRRLRAPAIPTGAIVYVISTFLDNEAARMAALWRASGHNVVAIDSLPTPRALPLKRESRAALRIVSMERQDRIDALRAVDVDVIAWRLRDGMAPETQLTAVTRASRSRR